LQKKRNPLVVQTVIVGKKHDAWKDIIGMIAGPRRNWANVNLDEIGDAAQAGETVVVPGKVLSQGEIGKKLKVVALGFSEKAKEKLLKAGCEVSSIMEEIKSNPEGKGIKVLK